MSSSSSAAATRGGGSSAKNSRARQELERQEAMLRDQPNVLVATPAGLLTHIRSGALSSDRLKQSVSTVVVDEADLVLSFGYADDVHEIVKSLPKICQGFLMSATLSPELDALKKIVLHSPVVLKLEQDENIGNGKGGQLKQFYITLPKKDKNLVIYVFLKLGLLKGKGLFFVNSTDAGYRVKLFLEQFHIRSAVLNAELPFRSRLNIIEQFNMGNFDYLIATDASTDVPDNGNDDDDNDSDDNDDDEDVVIDNSKSNQSSARKKDAEYGVSRGLDFRHVSFVVNVGFPPNPRSYAHRVGRTARGGAGGVALSLVELESKEENETLLAVQNDQPMIPLAGASTENLHASSSNIDNNRNGGGGSTAITSDPQEQPQPVPLDFDLAEIEGFRYRVEDVGRAVTKTTVRETRAAELRAEILNSERLQGQFFEENPADLQLLRHDRIATHAARVQEHLKHVPKYLLPRGMQVANLNRKRKRRKNKKGTNFQRRSNNDPLQSFNGEVNLDGVAEGGENEDQSDPFQDFMDDGEDNVGPDESSKKIKTAAEKKLLFSAKDGTGRSTAGRNEWKEKHRKGQFSKKKRKSDYKYKESLGI